MSSQEDSDVQLYRNQEWVAKSRYNATMDDMLTMAQYMALTCSQVLVLVQIQVKGTLSQFMWSYGPCLVIICSGRNITITEGNYPECPDPHYRDEGPGPQWRQGDIKTSDPVIRDTEDPPQVPDAHIRSQHFISDGFQYYSWDQARYDTFVVIIGHSGSPGQNCHLYCVASGYL